MWKQCVDVFSELVNKVSQVPCLKAGIKMQAHAFIAFNMPDVFCLRRIAEKGKSLQLQPVNAWII